MDIFELALKIEEDGEEVYSKLSMESESIGLRKIFKMLAEEGVRHIEVIREMRKNSKIESPTIEGLRPENVFDNLVDEESNFSVPDSEVAVYEQCLKSEIRSRDFYLEAIKFAEDEDAVSLLKALAREEEKHIKLLESIIEFVTFNTQSVAGE